MHHTLLEQNTFYPIRITIKTVETDQMIPSDFLLLITRYVNLELTIEVFENENPT